MKKMISLMTAVLLSVCLLTGCGENGNAGRTIEQGGQQVKDGVSSVMDAEKDMMNDVKNTVQDVGNGMNNAVDNAINNDKNNGMNNSNPTPTNEEKSKFIGEEKAKEIALKKGNVTTESVIFDRVELEKDDGVWKYEVDFKKDTTEYDAEINAIDGTVLKWEVEKD